MTGKTLRCCLILVFCAACVSAATTPTPLRTVFPGYPQFARDANIEGAFDIVMEVSASGLVTDVRIEGIHGISRASADHLSGTLMSALWQWKYPSTQRPFKVSLHVVYTLTAASEKPVAVFQPPSEIRIKAPGPVARRQ